jgi:simple sugar transport system substrate-binding protein
MKGAVAAARAAGIPVVGLNSGIDAWKQSGLLQYFGQDESVAGRAVGDKLDALRSKHALCVIHERGNVAVEARCAGVKKTFGGQTDLLYVDGTDSEALTDSVAAALRQDPTIDEVVMNGAQFALEAVKSVKDAGSKAEIATFDLNDDIVKAVQGGDVQFAVDQQPYLQGYLAVDAFWLYGTNGNVSGGGEKPVLTGPAFVTKENVASVAKYAAGGTR